MYKLTCGNNIGDIATGLFSRIALKILLVGKETASKALGVLDDNIGLEVGSRASDLDIDAFDAAKGMLMSSARGRKSVNYS